MLNNPNALYVQSSVGVYPLQNITTDICDAVVKTSHRMDENLVTIVPIPDAMSIEDGRVFCNKDVLKLSMSFFAIQNMFEYVVVRSDKKEYLVKCSHDDCSWICRSSRLGKTEIFKIQKLTDGHTCASNIVLGAHRQVSTSVVSSYIKYKYTSSCTIYTPNDICNDMLHTYVVTMNYVKAWRSQEITLKLIRRDPIESFRKLPSYFYMLEQINPRTVIKLKVDGHNRFKYCFMTLGASIEEWVHCKPVIVVDGTYLNGGTLFTACTHDANNNIFVLTFGVGDNENDASWTWFLENLRSTYGNREGLCFVSDRHNSIKNAVE
ncbi:uncharacterized protein LOC111385332 [Olea europaea var. sylvestris]|uniref:uncharacterized protein LOC111385332 n=1 Tax=Olea europaea var. sylvestris TaxID=158386 RepID=UPI000C1CCFA2|nr:uncharacterized protein LOC111385332 [Olea europaea var. sylvestris]